MRKIRVYVKTSKVGSRVEEVIEVDTDATDGQIDEIAREAMFGLIEWSWEEIA